MVSFEAYGDDEVVIKASELVTDFNPSTGWRVQGNFKDEIDREKIRIWEYRLNPELFKGYNPFCAVNILHDRLFIEYEKQILKDFHLILIIGSRSICSAQP